MFGDAGHGLILLSFGAYLCLDEKRYLKKKSLPEVTHIDLLISYTNRKKVKKKITIYLITQFVAVLGVRYFL